MRAPGLILSILLATAGLAAAASADERAAGDRPTPAVERGSEIAQSRCASCHAVALEAASPNHDAPQFRVLARLYSAEDLRRKLAEFSEHGHFEMPAVSIREDQIEDVAAYIASLEADAKPGADVI